MRLAASVAIPSALFIQLLHYCYYATTLASSSFRYRHHHNASNSNAEARPLLCQDTVEEFLGPEYGLLVHPTLPPSLSALKSIPYCLTQHYCVTEIVSDRPLRRAFKGTFNEQHWTTRIRRTCAEKYEPYLNSTWSEIRKQRNLDDVCNNCEELARFLSLA